MVGTESASTALALLTIVPQLGAVVIVGDHGTGKSTLVRGFGELLPFDAPFVEFPPSSGRTPYENAAQAEAAQRAEGTFRQADGGLLYFDSWQSLEAQAPTVASRLDQHRSPSGHQSSGAGGSGAGGSQFVVVSAVPNLAAIPHEFADRFSLAVQIATPPAAQRAEIVRRNLEFNADPQGFNDIWAESQREFARRMELARPGEFPRQLLGPIGAIAEALGVRSMRADVAFAQAASAYAGWQGRSDVIEEDLAAVAPWVFGHRLGHHATTAEAAGSVIGALEHTLGGPVSPALAPPKPASPPLTLDGDAPATPAGQHPAPTNPFGRSAARPTQSVGPTTPPSRTLPVPAQRRSSTDRPDGVVDIDLSSDSAASPGPTPVNAENGLAVPTDQQAVDSTMATGGSSDLDIPPAADAAAPLGTTRTLHPAGSVQGGLRDLIVLVVDTSANPGTDTRVNAARDAALRLIAAPETAGHQVALVVYCEGGAHVILRPTNSTNVAQAQLENIPSGGATTLVAGLSAGLSMTSRHSNHDPATPPLLVYLTNGDLTADDGVPDNTREAATQVAERVGRRYVNTLVVDWSPDATPRPEARELAECMGAVYFTPAALDAEGLFATVRSMISQVPAAAK
jgi:magnesium chelatase subunit D